MYHPNSTQPNSTMAGLQRTFNPGYASYFGDGTGRDIQIIINNGGLARQEKRYMGHAGVHFRPYASNAFSQTSQSPKKEASTFYYQSDGSGRDTYVLQNNGGLRFEYSSKNNGDKLFKSTLRSG